MLHMNPSVAGKHRQSESERPRKDHVRKLEGRLDGSKEYRQTEKQDCLQANGGTEKGWGKADSRRRGTEKRCSGTWPG